MRQLLSLSFIFLLLSSLSPPACSLNLQSKQTPLTPSSSYPLKGSSWMVLQTFGFPELIQQHFQGDPTQTIADLFAYYIDGRVLQNFVSAIFDRKQENNVISYQQLVSILQENNLPERNTPRVLDLISLNEDSKVDFVRFNTISNIIFNEALTVVTYTYIIEDKGDWRLASEGFDLETVKDAIFKIFKRLGNIYPAPRCEELEFLFEKSDQDHDKRLNMQEFHYLLSIFLTYYRSGIRNNEYAGIIFKDDVFEDLWKKEKEEEQKHEELVNFSSASFYKFLQMALHDDVLNLVGHILFSKFDTDGSGLISSDEFKALLGLFDSTDAEIALIFAASDSNSDGNIDFSEFLRALETLARRLTSEFGFIYLQETGQTVNFNNFWNLLQGFNQADLALISPTAVESIWNKVDNGDGVMDRDEFRIFISELITYWKKKIDWKKDQDIKDLAGLEPTDDNIQQVIDDKEQAAGNSGDGTSGNGGAHDAANDLVDQVTKDTPLENNPAETETESEASDDEETEGFEDAGTEETEATEATGSSEGSDDLTEGVGSEDEDTEATELSDEEPTETATEPEGDETEIDDSDSEEPVSDEGTESGPTGAGDEDLTEETELTDETESEPSEQTGSELSEASDEGATETGSEPSKPVSGEDLTEEGTETETVVDEETESEPTGSGSVGDEENETEPSEKTASGLTEVSDEDLTEATETVIDEETESEPTGPGSVGDEETETEPSEKTASELTEASDEDLTEATETVDDKETKSEPTKEESTELTETELTDNESDETDSEDTIVTPTPEPPKKRVLKMEGADFNGDGLTDFLRRPTSFLDKTNSQVFLSKGDGTFTIVKLPGSYYVPEDLTDVYIGDFNGDGYTDLFRREKGLWALDSKDTAQIFFSNGDGTFKTSELPESYKLQEPQAELSFGDFDGDGKTDFIVQKKLDLLTKTATLYLSNGDGTFKSVTIGGTDTPLTGSFVNLIVGDFNGDGKDDLLRQEKGLWALDNVDSATLLISNGDGTFKVTALPSSLDLKGTNVKLYVGDFNGDGNDDLISQPLSFLSSSTPGLYISNGKDGFTFQSLKGKIKSWDQAKIHIGNFDGDAKADFMLQLDSSLASPEAYLYLTVDTGSSSSVGFVTYSFKNFDIPGDFTNLYVGDYDGDGKSDFIRQEKGLWALDNKNSANVFFSSCEEQSVSSDAASSAWNVFKQVDLPTSYSIKGTSADLVVSNA